MIADSVPPVKYVRKSYSYYICGFCGKQISEKREICPCCNTPIDWKEKKRENR